MSPTELATARLQTAAAETADALRHRLILDSAIDVVIIATDCEGRVTEWNGGAERVLGWSSQEMQGETLDRIFTELDQADHRAAIEMQRALETGRADDQRRHLKKDGSLFWGSGEMRPLRGRDGAHVGFLKTLRDTTHDRDAAEAQRADAEFLRGVLAASGDCIKVLDLNAGLTFMSEGGQRVMEVSDFNAIRGCAWPEFWQDEGNAKAKAAVAAAKAGKLGHFVGQANTMAGTPKWWDVQVTPILGMDRRPEKLLCVSRDITATRQAEDALSEAQALNTLILNSSRDCIVVLDLEGHTRFVSPGGIEGMEISDLDAVLGQSWLRVWTGADQDAARAALDAARAGRTGRFQGLCVTHKGTPKWWDVAISSLPGSEGRPQQLVSVGRDISEARHAGELLALSEERLKVALSASGVVATWDCDLATDLVYADANYARIYSFDPARAAAGAPLAEYMKAIHPQDLPTLQLELDRRLADGAEFSSEYRIIKPDDSIRWIFARGRLVRDAQGVPVRFAGTSVDITEQKSAEVRQAFLLRMSDRLRVLSEPLAVLSAAAEELGRHLRVNRVGFGQIQPDDATVSLQGGYADGVEPISGMFSMAYFGTDNISRLRQGLTVVCDDVETDINNNPANWNAISTRSFVAVPLLRSGQFRAALYVNYRAVRNWSPREVALIEDVSARAWDALERARAETELRMSEKRLVSALTIASLGTFEWNTQTDAVVLSERGREIFGFGPDEGGHADDVFNRIHPQDKQHILGQALTSAREASRLETSYRIVLPDGVVRWVKSVSDAVLVSQGQPSRLVGVFEDVTSRVLAEQALRTSESQFRTLAQSIPHHVWTSHPDGQLDWFNDRVYAYSGAAPGGLDGDGWAGRMHPDDVTENSERWAAAVSSGEAFESELRIRRSDGAYRWHVARAEAVRAPDGQIVRWVGTSTDIEDQHAAREALAHMNVTLEARVEERTRERDRAWKNSRDLQLIIDVDGIIQGANEAWTAVLGWQPDEVIGRSHLFFSHPEEEQLNRAAHLTASAGMLPLYESRVRHKDGSFRWVSWLTAPGDGVVYASGRHVTAEKQAAADLHAAQEQLRQAQKMEAVGQLTGGVAHDFNNLLQIISANLHLMAKHVAGNENVQRRLASAEDAVRRGAKLAGQLLAFSRRQALEPKVINVGRFVLGMEDMLRRAVGEAIDIETVVSEGLWNTLIDPTQIENAVLNLAINSRDAMKGSGKLTINVANASLDQAYAQRHSEVTPGDYVMLAVSDTGAGMTPEVMAQVFEPFFSTKPVGSGTGLGLSMVYGFVKQSGGHVKLESEVEQGTTMKLYLPRAGQSEDVIVATDVGPVVGGTETILVAEDDEGVRETAVEMLGELGYRVLKAKDAASALTLIESGIPIDLLFTDVVMPGTLKSLELARNARQRLPAIAVLFTSGYTQNAITYGDRLEVGVELLAKPYTREALARRVRHVLTNPAQRGQTPSLAAALTEPPVAGSIKAGRLTVLLVEDDDLIRSSTAELLQDLGHAVVDARNAEDAMIILQGTRIDVLVTDLGLPGVSGEVFAAEARAVQPDLRIVFATASTFARNVIGDAMSPVLLSKPYHVADLASALAAATA